MSYKAVLFDFDYTLADSSAGIHDCITYALAQMDLPSASADATAATIGLSLPEALRRLTGPATPEQCAEFSRHFIVRADEIMIDSVVLYDTVRSVVPELKQRGLGLGVVSIKFRRRIDAVLQRENLGGYFDVIVGGEDVRNHKPDPEGALKAVRAFGASPHQVLYVGDSVVDAETARRAKLPFVAVLTGVTPKQEFESYQTIAVIESLSAVPRLINGSR